MSQESSSLLPFLLLVVFVAILGAVAAHAVQFFLFGEASPVVSGGVATGFTVPVIVARSRRQASSA